MWSEYREKENFLPLNVNFIQICLAVIIISAKFARRNKQKLIHIHYEIDENNACSIAAVPESRRLRTG